MHISTELTSPKVFAQDNLKIIQLGTENQVLESVEYRINNYDYDFYYNGVRAIYWTPIKGGPKEEHGIDFFGKGSPLHDFPKNARVALERTRVTTKTIWSDGTHYNESIWVSTTLRNLDTGYSCAVCLDPGYGD